MEEEIFTLLHTLNATSDCSGNWFTNALSHAERSSYIGMWRRSAESSRNCTGTRYLMRIFFWFMILMLFLLLIVTVTDTIVFFMLQTIVQWYYHCDLFRFLKKIRKSKVLIDEISGTFSYPTPRPNSYIFFLVYIFIKKQFKIEYEQLTNYF